MYDFIKDSIVGPAMFFDLLWFVFDDFNGFMCTLAAAAAGHRGNLGYPAAVLGH